MLTDVNKVSKLGQCNWSNVSKRFTKDKKSKDELVWIDLTFYFSMKETQLFDKMSICVVTLWPFQKF